MSMGARSIRRAILSEPMVSAGVIRNSRQAAADLARVEAGRRAFAARRGRRFGFPVCRHQLRVVLGFLARAALHELLAVAPGGLEAGVGLLRVDRNHLL